MVRKHNPACVAVVAINSVGGFLPPGRLLYFSFYLLQVKHIVLQNGQGTFEKLNI